MNARAYGVLTVILASVLCAVAPADAGSIVIPGWAYSGGNVRIDADPDEYADAGPVVVSGPKQPWGWTVEYAFDVPVEGDYALQLCYAAPDPRPMHVRIDSGWVGSVGYSATFDSADGTPTGKGSSARWERVGIPGKTNTRRLSKGKHTVMFTRRQELPNIVALRLDTDAEFPADWQSPRWTARDMDSIPATHRKVFQSAEGPRLELPPALVTETAEVKGTINIPATTFDRGNARIYASPDLYALTSPLVGDREKPDEDGVVEYDIDFPVAADYTLHIRYAAVELRPVDVFLDGRRLGRSCTGYSLSTADFVRPHDYPVSSRSTRTESLYADGKLLKVSLPAGKHTVKLARRGPLPHLASLKFETESAFPEGWKAPERNVDLTRLPPEHRGVFLPPGAVNVAAMRVAVDETARTFGARYPDGQSHQKRVSAIETILKAAEGGGPEELQQAFDTSVEARREIMLAHPLLDFDNLLFLKRPALGYGHTYSDQHEKVSGGSLCVLSPVSPDGKVTPLVPELEGGLFDRFDLSFDAKKVVFSYKKSDDTPFRIYEVDIDPQVGKMVPGSLRQLTFGGEAEDDALARRVSIRSDGYDDMDPCYLPNGKVMFVSSRAERIVFCHPSTVTTLYLMDADGGNLHRLSESPVNETAPSVLHDGRVIYTRWEYLDKGLAFAQSLWAVRPDGTGADHVYKNNTQWPAGMSSARAIPGSDRIVTIAGNHHFTAVGPVVVVDWRKSRNAPESMTCITPEGGYPGVYGYPQTQYGAFMDPYPLSEDFYIVSHDRGPSGNQRSQRYGLFLLDRWGNRAELYRDPAISCFEPMPLRPRTKPASIVGAAPRDQVVTKTGSLFLQDVYQGMPGIERGRVKYLRVMGALEWPWDQNGISWSLGADPHRKKIYGVVKVHEDGSAYFTVPADENVFFQALDKDYMALQEMSSYINLMPGEKRACIGCHEQRRKAPGFASGQPMAMDYPVQVPVPQPGETGPRMVDFTADIQPILDAHCITCHSGPKPKGRLDFVNVPVDKFSRSYNQLKDSGTICYRGGGKAGIRATPPLTHGSSASRLPTMLMENHGKTKLSREEFVRFVTWIDSNIPYNGTYRGNRHIEDKDDPDYRALPLAMK